MRFAILTFDRKSIFAAVSPENAHLCQKHARRADARAVARPAPGPFPPAVAPDVYHSHLAPFLRQRFPHCRTLGRDPFATRFRTRRERRSIRARARFSQLDAAAPRAAYRPPTAAGNRLNPFP
ncbi:hypothetical protein [Paraburkholderia sp. 32]|uniref:hypothetical protein n=1 Tax=Paraburkholderia sp. 32 TaxID=2991057 RepID=UPI003D1B9972